jgi:hypothetical protein
MAAMHATPVIAGEHSVLTTLAVYNGTSKARILLFKSITVYLHVAELEIPDTSVLCAPPVWANSTGKKVGVYMLPERDIGLKTGAIEMVAGLLVTFGPEIESTLWRIRLNSDLSFSLNMYPLISDINL